jgi:hypothetical protein
VRWQGYLWREILLSAQSYGNNASHDYSYDLGTSPSLPRVSAASSSVRPQPSRAARAATLSLLLKAHENRDWLLPTTSTREGRHFPKKKRTRWVQSTPKFSVAHKSTPEIQIQQDLTTCRDPGAPHTGKERRFSNKHCNNVLHEDEEPITGRRDDHYGWRLMPSWIIHPWDGY